MADTQRTLAAALALLADNTSGDISPQNLRDVVVSLFNNAGEMRLNATGFSGAAGTGSWTQLGFDADGPAAGCVAVDSTTNNRITVSVDGLYRVRFHCTATTSDSARPVELRLEASGGGTQAGNGILTVTDTREYSYSFETLLNLSAGDYLEIYHRVSSGGMPTLTVRNGSLVVQKVG